MKHSIFSQDTGFALFVNRIALGLLFLIPGVYKVFMPQDFLSFLMEGPIPAGIVTPLFYAVTLFEIVAAVCLLIGYKVRWVGPPLAAILFVALVTVVITDLTSKILLISILFHVAGILFCLSLWWAGPGKWALEK